MTDRCEPPLEWRGTDGWHWLQIDDWPATVNRWVWDAHENLGFWHPLISAGTRYLSPVLTPAEAAALRAENARLREALRWIAQPLDLRDLPHTKGNAVTWGMDIARAALAQEDKP